MESSPEDFARLVDEELAKLETSYSGEAIAQRAVTAYHRAAAVLSTFDTHLHPAGETAPGESIEDLLVDAEPVVRSERLQFRLLPEVRRHVLATLGTRDAMQSARSANASTVFDAVQSLFDRYLAGTAPPLERQTLAELAASFEIAPWLSGLVPNVPQGDEVRARLELETLLSPFEDLVGAHFGGREKDLQTLRDYVGVLEPSTFVEGFWREVRDVFSFHDKPPLVIYGPGGYGKSTLLARFILEHARLDDAQRFPFVYIDFDRASIAADEPLTILVEAVRQLGIQYVRPQKRSEDLREAWRRRMGRLSAGPSGAKLSSGGSTTPRARRDRAPFFQDFTSLVDSLGLHERPMLLVLDTFEEVQQRSTAYVRELWMFLGELQKEIPRLRTVLSGRAPVTGIGFDNEPLATQLHELGRLDVGASSAILEKQGLPPDMARRIASRVGGSPLTLRLAAQLVKKVSARPDESVDEEFDEDALERAVADDEIERYLFTRILEHIPDTRLRALAHPGLVLRRVSADLIWQVLAVPCGLNISSEQDAQQLFEGLRHEVALVTPSDERDTLRHRPDLRQLMLRFMERDALAQVQRIHRDAANYYRTRNQTNPIERAEEIYHRLAGGEYGPDLDARWISGVETWLFSALEELPAAPSSWLASRLHVELQPEHRAEAPLDVWERDALRRARELQALNEPASVLQVLQERSDRSGASPLSQVHADALVALGQLDEALQTLDRGIARAFQSGSDALRVDLQIAAAKLELQHSRVSAVYKRLEEVEPIALRRDDTLQLMDIALTRIDAYRAAAREQLSQGDSKRIEPPTPIHVRRWLRMGPPVSTLEGADEGEDEDIAALRDSLREWCGASSDGQLIANPDLARRVGAEVGSNDHVTLVRVIKLAGIGTPEQRHLRALGEALAEWDEQLARRDPTNPAWSALDVTPLNRLANFNDAAERTWQSFVLTAPLSDVDAACRRIVGEFSLSARVAVALANVLGGDTVSSAPSVSESASKGATRLRGSEVNQAVQALIDVFPTAGAMARFIELRFNRHFGSIALGGQALQATALSLVRRAEAEGWIAELLVSAHQANPGKRRVRELIEELGLVTSTAAVLQQLARPGVDWNQLALRLCELTSQVCRIEPSGLNDGPYASGFLIGPDVVLTVHSALLHVINGSSSAGRVQVRFDYVRSDDRRGETGTVFGLARSGYIKTGWLIDSAADLDFACIRVSGQPGHAPVGGESAVADAPPRGWIQLPGHHKPVELGKPIVLCHYPRAEPVKLTLDRRGIERITSDGWAMRYRASTSPGSTGAPIFDADLQLIGLHRGTVGGWRNFGVKQGTPMTAIVEYLRNRGTLAHVTGTTSA